MAAKNVYKELEHWESKLNQINSTHDVGTDDHKTAVSFIIEALFSELNLQIYQYDKEGKLIYDRKGRPKINWINVVTGVVKLVGKIIFLKQLFESQTLVPGGGNKSIK